MYILNGNQGLFTFDEKREYLGDPTYIALKDSQKNYFLLLRKLSNSKNINDYNNIYYFIDRKNKECNLYEPYVFLFKLESFREADKIISSYRKAIKTLPN